jgi:hypothetical protein
MSSYLTTSAAASTYAVIARGLPAAGTTGQVLSKVNGTDYNATWTTIIPGDRYLTTSSTSNAVSNGNKTFTVGAGLSYTTQQDVTIAYDAAHHMHGLVLTYNSGTGVMTVDVNSHTGTGTYNSWVVNVGGTVPLASIAWGDITGTLGDQSDLATALNAKLETSTAATTYLALAGGAMTGSITSAGTTYDTEMAGDLFGVQLSADHSKGSVLQFNGLDTYDGSSHMLVTPTGLTFPDSTVQTTAYTGGGGGGYISSVTSPLAVTSGDLSIDLSSYLTTSTAASTYVPFTGGTMSGLLTSESGTNIAGMNNDGFSVTQAGDYFGGLSSTVMQVYHSEAETYGTGTSSGSVTRNEISHSYSGFDSSGSVSRYAQLANTSGFTGAFTSTAASGTYSLTADGIAGSQTNYGTTTSFSYGPGGIHFQSGSTYAEFTLSGIRFPDGSTQSTAASSGLSAPPYYTAVWAYGGWYSANVTNIMDGNYTYWNVITV